MNWDDWNKMKEILEKFEKETRERIGQNYERISLSESMVGRLQTLIWDVKALLERGRTETAIALITEFTEDGWSKAGWHEYFEKYIKIGK